jgi:polar amino acid transport system substrate-binding protein
MLIRLLSVSITTIAAVFSLSVAVSSALAAENLTVGAYPANPPWETKKDDGSFEGFEIDLANEIANRVGLSLTFQDLNFQALFAAIASGRIDIAVSSIAITNERLKNVSFTQPYFDSDMGLMTQTGSPITSFEAMKGKKIGGIATSSGEAWIKENFDAYGFGEYKSYDTQNNLLLDVKIGRLDGAVGDLAGFQFAETKISGIQISSVISTGDKVAMMLKKSSPLLEKVDGAITEIKTDGTMAKLFNKWFGVDPRPGSSTIVPAPIPQAQ